MSAESVRLLHISDPHLHAHRDARMRGLNTYESFKSVLEHARNSGRQPDAVIATGDLVQDETRQGYQRFRELTEPLKVPVHCIPGNHDAPSIMSEMLNEPPFQFCGNAVYDNWCLLMLNTAMKWNECGNLEQEQLESLEHSLNEHSGRHVMICMHHHPIPMGSHWLDGIGLQNNAAFLDIVDRHNNVRCIAWGHVHQASDRLRQDIRMLSTPSTGAQFLPESDTFMIDTKPAGYRWLELHPDGTIDTEVIWIG